jgi:membrane-associated phospholipid phosphatase
MRQKLIDLDLRTTTSLRIAEKPGLLRNLAVVLAHSGDSWFWLIGLALLWWQGTPFWQARAQFLALGVVLTAMTVMLIKLTVRRTRPEGDWGGLYRSTDPHSFPSGHAARAMLLAVLVLSAGPAWFAAVLLVWAPLVSVARVAMGVHYLLDVLAGMGLGLVIGLIFPFFYPV